jgi:heme/copper-type cytochrome/quinol oxidase subunit 2
MFACLAATAYTTRAQNTPVETGKEFRLTARKYQFSPTTIKVKQGDRVRLIITAIDADHGFKLEAFNIGRTLPKGEPVMIEFTADQTGSFPFECSHFCGFGHRKMKGQLTVE